jgi:hypothetical protein
MSDLAVVLILHTFFFLVLNVRMMSLISYRFQQLPTTNAQTIQKSQQSINRQL